MNKISLIGMEFYAYHGVYEEERIIGSYYVLDVEVEATINTIDDDVTKVVNYEDIYRISSEVMKEPVKLIETIASKIEVKIKEAFFGVSALKIIVHKKNPPLGGKVEESKFEYVQNYRRKCPKCGRSNICYNSESCWCKAYQISPSTAQNLKENYEGCICENCFSEFGNKI